MSWALLLLLAGCTKKAPPALVDSTVDRAPSGPVRVDVEGPVAWKGAGLCLSILEEWSGSSGPAPQLLELVHEGTGATVRLQAWPWGTPMPQERPSFVTVYGPELARYRTVPLLHPARTYTLSSLDGRLVQGWVGTVDGRLVVVEHEAPFGRTTAGRDATEGLLASLRRCDGAARPPTAGR